MLHALKLLLAAHQLPQQPLLLDEAARTQPVSVTQHWCCKQRVRLRRLPAVDAVQLPLQPVSYNNQLILRNRLRHRHAPNTTPSPTPTTNSRLHAIGCRSSPFLQLLL